MPAINDAARSDTTVVTRILSECPTLSEVNFVCKRLDLPPEHDSKQLQDYAIEALAQGGAPLRPFGTAELLVEASFADLRQGGDGNIKQIKNSSNEELTNEDDVDHPFPDSWIATSAGISLGFLIDVVDNVLFDMKDTHMRQQIWSLIFGQFQNWIIGTVDDSNMILPNDNVDRIDDELSGLTHSEDGPDPWQTSEALVRLASSELSRLTCLLAQKEALLSQEMTTFWWNAIVSSVTELLNALMKNHDVIKAKLIKTKLEEVEKYKLGGIDTAFGKAALIEERDLRHDMDSDVFAVRILKLEWGATLYEPLIYGFDFEDNETVYLKKMIPQLKLNAISSYSIATDIVQSGCMADEFLSGTSSQVTMQFLDSLVASCELASVSRSDKDLAHAFSEYKRLEWGDSLQEVENFLRDTKGLPIECQYGGNGSYYLPQEAKSTRALIQFLSQLFYTRDLTSWNSVEYAEPLLLNRISNVLQQHIQSEQDSRRLLNTKAWTDPNSNERKQVALYCLTFSDVVTYILDVMLQLDNETLQKYLQILFPLCCDLIRSRNDEIRIRVSRLMKDHIGQILLNSINK